MITEISLDHHDPGEDLLPAKVGNVLTLGEGVLSTEYDY